MKVTADCQSLVIVTPDDIEESGWQPDSLVAGSYWNWERGMCVWNMISS